MLGRNAVELDEDEGRTGDVGKHPGDGDAPGQGMAKKYGVGQQPTVLTQRTGQRLTRYVGRQAFRQARRNRQPRQRTETGQGQKNRLPACRVDQQPTQQWRKDGSKSHHQHQLRKDFRRPHRITLVANHRPGNHHPRATAQRLDETRADQPFQVRCIGARHGSNGEQTDTDEQRNASPETIRHRTIGQLTDGQAEEVGRQRHLDMIFVRAESQGHGREGRQVEIDRQRTESAQGAENQNGTEVHQASSGAEVGSPTV
ncbi:hypothetical protein PS647_03145 [Pseudomonas fluorescens]|nr:hypothetical protein PS647_03145 [Pseudomonas fluorescens]